MTTPLPPHIAALPEYRPGFNPAELSSDEISPGLSWIKLSSNENPYGCAPEVAQALSASAHDLHRYPDVDAQALRAALGTHHGCAAAEVCVTNGSNALIDLLVQTFTSPSDRGVVGVPSFPCYDLALRKCGREAVAVPLRDHLHWHVGDLLDTIDARTRLVFVANPNNPTGAYLPRVALEAFLRAVPPDRLVVVDEAYAEFATADDFSGAWALRALHPGLVVLRTFSKAYGIAGARVGYALADAAIIAALHRVRPPFHVGTLAQAAACAALGAQQHIVECRRRNAEQRQWLLETLRGAGYRCADSQANFILIRVAPTQAPTGAAVSQALLARRIIVRPLSQPLAQWIRVTVGTPEQNQRCVAELCAMENQT